jgi:hypothetical protein
MDVRVVEIEGEQVPLLQLSQRMRGARSAT